jgi:hypothetical protein
VWVGHGWLTVPSMTLCCATLSSPAQPGLRCPPCQHQSHPSTPFPGCPLALNPKTRQCLVVPWTLCTATYTPHTHPACPPPPHPTPHKQQNKQHPHLHRREFLLGELRGRRPLMPPGMDMSPDVREVVDTFRWVSLCWWYCILPHLYCILPHLYCILPHLYCILCLCRSDTGAASLKWGYHAQKAK